MIKIIAPRGATGPGVQTMRDQRYRIRVAVEGRVVQDGSRVAANDTGISAHARVYLVQVHRSIGLGAGAANAYAARKNINGVAGGSQPHTRAAPPRIDSCSTCIAVGDIQHPAAAI